MSVVVGTVEPVYYGHLGTSKKCPDNGGVFIFQVILHIQVSFVTSSKCLDYAGVLIFKCPHTKESDSLNGWTGSTSFSLYSINNITCKPFSVKKIYV